MNPIRNLAFSDSYNIIFCRRIEWEASTTPRTSRAHFNSDDLRTSLPCHGGEFTCIVSHFLSGVGRSRQFLLIATDRQLGT